MACAPPLLPPLPNPPPRPPRPLVGLPFEGGAGGGINGSEAGRNARAGFGTCGVAVSPTAPAPRPLFPPLPRRWRGGRVRVAGACGASTADMMLELMFDIVFDSKAVANVCESLQKPDGSILLQVLSVWETRCLLMGSDSVKMDAPVVIAP
jgi:hypothetical protein